MNTPVSSRPIRALAVVAAGALAVACEQEPAPPPPSIRGALEEGVVARVGDLEIGEADVRAVVARQGRSPEEALDGLVRDALFAIEAERRGLAAEPRTAALVRAALAREMLASLAEEARAEGPIRDDELAEWTERAWIELARPESFRTVHAVVTDDDRSSADWDEARWEAARETAEILRKRVTPAVDLARLSQPPAPTPGAPPAKDPAAEEFIRLAKAVSADQPIVVEALPPITKEGLAVEPSRRPFDAKFAGAASTLSGRGDLSAIVESPFGVHVIMLLERIPERFASEDERRALLGEPILQDRVHRRQKDLLTSARAAVSIDPQADGILAELPAVGAGEGVR